MEDISPGYLLSGVAPSAVERRTAHLTVVPRSLPFIIPAQPALRSSPPTGEVWLHEVKFDGYRLQLQKNGKAVSALSRTGADFSARFPVILHALQHLPVKSVILDAEVVAVGANGKPDFSALHARSAKPEDVMAWCFDLLHHNGHDTRALPLSRRRDLLSDLLVRFDHGFLDFSEGFTDGVKLLAACEKQGLEGIVSKRLDALYRSGKCDWVKVKTAAWREANKDRGELFGEGRR